MVWYDYSKKDDRLPAGLNKKLIGKFKDELKGKVMTKFIALASKVYAYLDDNNNGDERIKGIKKICKGQGIKVW